MNDTSDPAECAMQTTIKVAIVEDRRATREGLALLIVGAPGYDQSQTGEGQAQVFLGNEGRARYLLPSTASRVARPDRPSAFAEAHETVPQP